LINESFYFSHACNNKFINTSFTHFDSKITLFSPRRSPRIGNLPEMNSSFYSPSSNLNSMTSPISPWVLNVNTTSIIKEIIIHSETSLNWTIRHYFHLNTFHILHFYKRIVYTIISFLSWTIFTLIHTSRNMSWGWLIRPALVRYSPNRFKEQPLSVKVSSITTEVSLITTDHKLRRHHFIHLTIWSNTESIW
jgi:hypothetical protein